MDAVREKLREFYAESFRKMLKVRTTKANRILTMTQGSDSMTIAKFNAEVNPELADQLMDQCKARVIEILVDMEMKKLDDAKDAAGHLYGTRDADIGITPDLDI